MKNIDKLGNVITITMILGIIVSLIGVISMCFVSIVVAICYAVVLAIGLSILYNILSTIHSALIDLHNNNLELTAMLRDRITEKVCVTDTEDADIVTDKQPVQRKTCTSKQSTAADKHLASDSATLKQLLNSNDISEEQYNSCIDTLTELHNMLACGEISVSDYKTGVNNMLVLLEQD